MTVQFLGDDPLGFGLRARAVQLTRVMLSQAPFHAQQQLATKRCATQAAAPVQWVTPFQGFQLPSMGKVMV